MNRFVLIFSVFLMLLGAAGIHAQNVEYVGSTLWTGVIDVEVVGNYAYCAFVNGLVILDISDPAAPVFVSQYFLQGYGKAIDVSGSYAYVADASFGLQIVNISNPSSPTLVGSLRHRCFRRFRFRLLRLCGRWLFRPSGCQYFQSLKPDTGRKLRYAGLCLWRLCIRQLRLCGR